MFYVYELAKKKKKHSRGEGGVCVNRGEIVGRGRPGEGAGERKRGKQAGRMCAASVMGSQMSH